MTEEERIEAAEKIGGAYFTAASYANTIATLQTRIKELEAAGSKLVACNTQHFDAARAAIARAEAAEAQLAVVQGALGAWIHYAEGMSLLLTQNKIDPSPRMKADHEAAHKAHRALSPSPEARTDVKDPLTLEDLEDDAFNAWHEDR